MELKILMYAGIAMKARPRRERKRLQYFARVLQLPFRIVTRATAIFENLTL